jgi:hypothetical protein
MIIHNQSGKVAIVKVFHETMSISETSGENPTSVRRWVTSSCLNERCVEPSTIAINGKYIFDNNHIDYFLSNDTHPHNNVYTYHANVNDLKEITEWISPFFNNRFVLVTDNNYTYAIQDDLPYNFNSDVFDFKEGDRRILIKYVILINLVCYTIR